jgi:hypothetical protein
MAVAAFSDKWVAVFWGPHALADLFADELRSAGIPTFVPDSNLRILDPQAAGGYIFHKSVLVPRARAADARELLPHGPRELGDARVSQEPTNALRSMRNLLVVCACLPMFAPIGLWLSRRYFREARLAHGVGARHGWAIAATAVCALVTTGEVARLAFSVFTAFAGAR